LKTPIALSSDNKALSYDWKSGKDNKLEDSLEIT